MVVRLALQGVFGGISVRDTGLKDEIGRVHRQNFSVYGVEKVWRQLLREGIQVGRDHAWRG